MKSLKTLLMETLEGNMESYNLLTFRIGTMLKKYYSEEVLDNNFDDLVSKWVEYMIEFDYVNKPSTHVVPGLVAAMQRDAAVFQTECKAPYCESEFYNPEADMINKINIKAMLQDDMKRHGDYNRINMVRLHIIDGYTQKEVAEMYGVDIDTVRRCIEKQLRRFRHPYGYRFIR